MYKRDSETVASEIYNLLFLLILTLAHIRPAFAQQYTFRNYTGEDGLSQLIGQTLLQDQRGYLWIGTQAGLNRFDGTTFEVFGIRQGLANDRINALAQDSKGAMWIGSNGGLTRYTETGFTNFTDEDGLSDNHVLSILVDKQEQVWCGTQNGVSRWDGVSFRNFMLTTAYSLLLDRENRLWIATQKGLYHIHNGKAVRFEGRELDGEAVYAITEDRDGRMWVGTREKVLAYRDRTCVARYTLNDGLPQLVQESVLYASRDGDVWVGTPHGLAVIHQNKLRVITTENGLPFNDVRSILEDREGIIWIGGFGGVAKFLGRAFTTYTAKDGLGADNVRPITRGPNGNLWVGTIDGLSRFDGENWHTFSTPDGLLHQVVYCLLLDSYGYLWIGTRGGMNYYDGEKIHIEEALSSRGMVVSIVEDTSGTIWCSVSGVGIFKGRTGDFQKITFPNEEYFDSTWGSGARLLADNAGNIWATGARGISSWNGKFWRTFTTEDGLANNEPYFIAEDHSGHIWFGYHSSHGITRFDGESFKTYTTKEGLHNDAVYSIGVDQKNNIWIGTALGVDRFNGEHFINYGPAEGYASYESNSGGFFADDDGTLWFGTAEGLSHYNPSYDLSYGDPPPIVIQKLSFGNKEITERSEIEVQYGHNDLQAYVAALSHVNRKRIEIRYRLVGYHDQWQRLTTDHRQLFDSSALLANLVVWVACCPHRRFRSRGVLQISRLLS